MKNLTPNIGVFAVVLLVLCACKPTNELKAPQPDFVKTQPNAIPLKTLERSQQSLVDQLFLDAMTAFVLEDWRKAEALFVQLTGIDPLHAAAFYKLSGVYIELGRFNTAAIYAERACQLEPKNTDYIEGLAQLFRKLNRTKAAIATWAYLINLNPNNKEYITALAQEYYTDKDWIAAIKALDFYLARHGDDPDILEIKANLLFEFKHLKEAEPIYQTLLQIDPTQSRYYLRATTALLSLGKYTQMHQLMNRWATVLPDDPARRLIQIAYYSDRKDTAKVHALLKQLLTLPNTNSETLAKVVYNSLNRNFLDIELRDLVRQRAQVGEPSPNLFELLINIDIELNDSLAMIEDGNLYMSHFHMPLMGAYAAFIGYSMIGNDSMQCNLFDSIAWYHSGVPEVFEHVLMMQTNVYERRDDESSLLFYEQCLSQFPNNTHFLNNLAYHLCQKGVQLERAVAMAQKALSLSQEPHIIDTYAWALFLTQRYEYALEIIELIPVDQLNEAVYFEHYGDILFQNNKLEKALQMWQKAYDLNPEDCSPKLLEKISKKSINP